MSQPPSPEEQRALIIAQSAALEAYRDGFKAYVHSTIVLSYAAARALAVAYVEHGERAAIVACLHRGNVPMACEARRQPGGKVLVLDHPPLSV